MTTTFGVNPFTFNIQQLLGYIFIYRVDLSLTSQKNVAGNLFYKFEKMDREIKANWDCKEASIVDSKKRQEAVENHDYLNCTSYSSYDNLLQ